MSKTGIEALSPQQRRCLRLVAKGWGTQEIAHELDLAESTVNSYLAGAVAKLGAPNRRRAAAMFAEAEQSENPPEKLLGEKLRVDPISFSPASTTSARVHEDGIEFSKFDLDNYLKRAPDPNRGETGNEELNRPLRTVALITGIAVAIIIMILAAGPLAQSASELANTIQSHRNN